MAAATDHRAEAAPDRLLLLRHDARLIANAVARFAQRPADVATALVALPLLGAAVPAGWRMIAAAQVPRATAGAVILLFFLLSHVTRRVERRLDWFAAETPFAATALREPPRRAYRMVWVGGATLLVGMPFAAALAVILADARLLGLAALAGGAGVLHGRRRRGGESVPSGEAANRPAPHVQGAALLDVLVRVRQLPLPTRLAAGWRGLAAAAGFGVAAGAAACLAASLAPPASLRLVGGLVAILTLVRLTFVDVAVAAAAARLGYPAGRLALAYLAVPAAALASYLALIALAGPLLRWVAAAAGALVLALLALHGLLRALRSNGGATAVAGVAADIEIAAILLIGFYLPPAGVAVAVWRIVHARRIYQSRMWRAD